MTRNVLRERIKAGEASFGLWVTLESPSLTEIAAAMGLDWVCIDTDRLKATPRAPGVDEILLPGEPEWRC